MRSAIIIAAASAALTLATPAQAGLPGWLGGGGGASSSSGSGGSGSDSDSATDVPAPPALAIFGMAVTGLILGRRRRG